jgi:hypothetical protein
MIRVQVGVHRHRVVPQNQDPAGLGCPLDGTVAFHPLDSVHDHKVRPDRAVEIE